ncbi:hypothetical protein EV421DRAFT_1904224 [Armillaria borealis]|uniref:Uncharacterized protein n=1 Tax=Armillaria borealis TaxID=47425 RepID=A0AA39JI96_9AGAR|nr:hypothetical protein EV421DRAFT_1904224 [Armillaria borealis]
MAHVLAILLSFPKLSTVTPRVVILALTMAKDGYKDIKRCQSQIIAKVLSGGGWHNPNVLKSKASPSSELSSLAGGNQLLAHVTVEDTGNKKHSLNDDYDNNWWSMLKEYYDENEAFVETKNLDKETDVKFWNAVPTLTHLRHVHIRLPSKYTTGKHPDNSSMLLGSA